MNNKPDIIYLQICDDNDYIKSEFEDWNELDEKAITHSSERINKCDLEYFSKEFCLDFFKFVKNYEYKHPNSSYSVKYLFEQFKKQMEYLGKY